ncbi:hypothetical protein MN116_008917 [Schistosoma mekongi]|uniref:Uncharacterized protein n=1 Tax=Schistosoma mekongi TaxID=38744 RepID=A0AAE2D177_SCHME|nr:hypothetical protein MN116_008917 [Schistosoma mekongi]
MDTEKEGEKRPYSSTNSNALQVVSQHHNHSRSHTGGSQNPHTNHPYHGHNRGPPSHFYGNEHFNRSHSNRPPGPESNEPDPKRQRFDRQFPNQYRRSPQPHLLGGHHPDGAGRINNIYFKILHINLDVNVWIRLYDNVEPTVIDMQLLRDAIFSLLEKGTVSELAKQDGIHFENVKHLRLDYKNILKNDNLWAFKSLAKLQLDNNIIENIEGIDQ